MGILTCGTPVTHLIFWSCILISVLSAQVHGCPEACTCEDEEGETTVKCLNLQLTSFPHTNFPENTIKVKFVNSTLQHLTRTSFPELPKLRSLVLDGCKIVSVGAVAFARLPRLEFLSLSNNAIEYVDPYSLRVTPRLRSLHLNNNRIVSLPDDLFADLQLDEVLINNNLIESIGVGTFRGARIGYLDISNNYLSSLRNDFFLHLASSLYDLKISNNKRALTLDFDVFDGFNFTSLNMSSSMLTEHGFIQFSVSETIDISHNQFRTPLDLSRSDTLKYTRNLFIQNTGMEDFDERTLSSLTGLRTLDMSHNSLWLIYPDYFRALTQLREIDLSYNQIFELRDSFSDYLSELRTLDVSHNVLDSIGAEVFTGMSLMRSLDLSHNKLQVFPNLVKDVFDSLSFLDLSHNPLHCNCEMAWFRKWIDTTSLQTGADMCASPFSAPILSLNADDFRCKHPRIFDITESQNVEAGENLVLSCKAKGDPAPVVHWFDPSGETFGISPTPDRREEVTSAIWQLTFEQASRGGWYRCEAISDGVGFDEQFTYINVISADNGAVDIDALTYPPTPHIPTQKRTTTPSVNPPTTQALSTTSQTTTIAQMTSQQTASIQTTTQQTTQPTTQQITKPTTPQTTPQQTTQPTTQQTTPQQTTQSTTQQTKTQQTTQSTTQLTTPQQTTQPTTQQTTTQQTAQPTIQQTTPHQTTSKHTTTFQETFAQHTTTQQTTAQVTIQQTTSDMRTTSTARLIVTELESTVSSTTSTTQQATSNASRPTTDAAAISAASKDEEVISFASSVAVIVTTEPIKTRESHDNTAAMTDYLLSTSSPDSTSSPVPEVGSAKEEGFPVRYIILLVVFIGGAFLSLAVVVVLIRRCRYHRRHREYQLAKTAEQNSNNNVVQLPLKDTNGKGGVPV